MVATIYKPGDPRFCYFVGTMNECLEWIILRRTEPIACTGITSNKKAARWRYRGGAPVIPNINQPNQGGANDGET